MTSAIGHLDIKVSDLDRAKEFYQKVLKVEFFSVGEKSIRASLKQKPDITLSEVDMVATGATFCPFLEVQNLNNALTIVRELGGELVGEPWTLEERKVRMAQVKDTEGNVIGLFYYL